MAKSWPSYISSLKGYGHPAGPSWKSPLLKGVTTHSANLVPTLDEEGMDCSYKTHRYYPEPSFSTLKPWYSEQVCQTFLFTILNNSIYQMWYPQNGSWVLFTISRNSLYWGSLYQGLSVLGAFGLLCLNENVLFCWHKETSRSWLWRLPNIALSFVGLCLLCHMMMLLSRN